MFGLMKILYNGNLDVLDEFSYLYKRDVFRRKNLYYKFMPACIECGDSYFMRTTYPTKFCSRECTNSSMVTRKKISKSTKGKVLTEKQKKALHNVRFKGGVTEKNLPLFKTYAQQLSPVEVVKDNGGLLYVKCSLCKKWFLPKRTQVEARSQFIKGNSTSESRFYCSEECKLKCPIFHKKLYPKGTNPRKDRANQIYTESALRVWSKEVLKQAVNICEICGSKATLAHHIKPKKLYPNEALDIDNGIALCLKCHYKVHVDECSFINLAKFKCIKD
jgi:hypothetical protein